MTTYATGNPLGSKDPRDLYDNAENLDKLVNGAEPFYADRKGKLRESWSGMENSFNNAQEGRETAFTLSQADKESRFQAFLVSSGYVSKGDYAAGVVLAERNEYVAVSAATTGTTAGLYRPGPGATLPLTLTGTWATDSTDLVLLGDDVLRHDLGGDTGATFIGFRSPLANAVARTAHGKLSDFVSVKDFGAVGDGIVDDSAAFLAAHTNVAAGVEIYVPPGTYRFASNVTVTRRNFFFNGSSITGPGRLVGALTRMIDPVTGGVSYGVGEPYQYGSYYKFGSNVAGPIGLVVGGADPRFGVDGNALFADSYGGWSAFSPTRYLSSCEFAVQPASSAGSCTTLVGGNVVTRTGGGEFLAEFVGRRIYIDQGKYRVASVNVPAQTLTVTELNGTPVVFSVPGPFTFVFVGVKGSGTCNVSGTAVTRVTGDPFVPFGNTEYLFYLNGVSNQATAVSDYNNLTLLNPAVSGTNVPYEFWTSIDDLSSAVRVHRVAGAGFEENLTLGAYAAGYFHVHSAGGGGRQYPMYLGTGYDGASLKRRQVGLQTNGRITLGGDADKCSLVIEDGGGSATNYLVVSGSAASGSGTPALSAQGASTNIGIAVSTKGNLSTKFSSGNFSSIEFEISSNTAGTSWLAVRSDAYNQPMLYADGASENIDIRLIPKGTGRVLIGPYTAGSGTINGWIEVKDSTGSLRKVAILT